MKWKDFKGLKYLEHSPGPSKNCVIAFHGYGANANDLSDLAENLHFEKKMDFLFPRGLIPIYLFPGVYGRAWFELKLSENIKSSFTEILPDKEKMGEIQKVISHIRDWLNNLSLRYDNIFIGGFSQGAVLVSHCFHRLDFAPKGLFILSGTLILPSLFHTLPESLKIPFFQCHGTQDSVLEIQGGRQLYEKLLSLGLKGQWYEFQGEHSIPQPAVSKLNHFISSTLKKS